MSLSERVVVRSLDELVHAYEAGVSLHDIRRRPNRDVPLAPAHVGGGERVTVSGVSKAFGERTVLTDLDFEVPGDSSSRSSDAPGAASPRCFA